MLLRRITSPLAFSSTLVNQLRCCSSSNPPVDESSNSNDKPRRQQSSPIPQILQQFDHHMRTNPEFRKLYPQLLNAIVTKSKQDIVSVADQMSKALSQGESGMQQQQHQQQHVPEVKSNEKKEPTSTSSTSSSSSSSNTQQLYAQLALNLIVVDVAFADMFYNASANSQNQEQSDGRGTGGSDQGEVVVNPIEAEESDEQLLELLLSHFGDDFKKQKARIGKFILETIQKERDQLMITEKGLEISSFNRKFLSAQNNSNKRRSASATLPNFAVTVTPPIDAENTITAKPLLELIKAEIGALSDLCDGDKRMIVSSVLKRRVFSGAVGGWDEKEQEQIDEMTLALFNKQKKKAIGDVEFDPEVNMLACRVAVENDFVENKLTNGRGDGKRNNNLLLRFDIGAEESTFASAIGLDLFFDFSDSSDTNDGKRREKAEAEMEEAATEICRRVSEKINAGFRNGKCDENSFGEEAILPFAFTMRCKIMMKQ